MRADIHDGQEARNAPRNGPNTDARDQLSPDRHIRLAPHGRSIQNEIGCARISMMARKQEALPAMGRIQMRETNYLQIVTSGLHRTAGPYKVHGQATWTSKSGMADLSAKPRAGHCRHGSVRGPDHWLQTA